MTISYQDPLTRECCYSLSLNIGNSPFDKAEILTIRALVSDLRAAPKLSDVPFPHVQKKMENGGKAFSILIDQIKITFVPISTYPHPAVKQIDRIKILEIKKIDLQLEA